jgi:hypothetical protein
MLNIPRLFKVGLGLWCLTPLATIFQLYRGSPFYWPRKTQYISPARQWTLRVPLSAENVLFL